MKKIVLTANTSWYLYNFRLGLIKELIKQKNKIFIVAPKDNFSPKLKDLGCTFFSIKVDNKGSNPIKDLSFFYVLRRIYKKINPDIVLHYTIKPVIYGSFASQKLSIPHINNITGLGTVFIDPNWITFFVKILYKKALIRSSYVFFQNKDDYKLFIKNKLISKFIPISIIPGTGIDLDKFKLSKYPKSSTLKFLFIGRILKDKGFFEFVEVAKRIKNLGFKVDFKILGYLNAKNKTAITESEINHFQKKGYINYLGSSDNVIPFINDASCVVLPSYREGLPKSLLEAASIGRPIIATDVTGCRDIVSNGKNGFLCKPRNIKDLYQKVLEFISLPYQERKKLGENGREIMKKNFDEKKVIKKIINHINQIV